MCLRSHFFGAQALSSMLDGPSRSTSTLRSSCPICEVLNLAHRRTATRPNTNRTTSEPHDLTGKASLVRRNRPRTWGQPHGRSVDRSPFFIDPNDFPSFTLLHTCPSRPVPCSPSERLPTITALSPSPHSFSPACWPIPHSCLQHESASSVYELPLSDLGGQQFSAYSCLGTGGVGIAQAGRAHARQRVGRSFLCWQIIRPHPVSASGFYEPLRRMC